MKFFSSFRIPSSICIHLWFLLRLLLAVMVSLTLLVFGDLGSFEKYWLGILWNVLLLFVFFFFYHDWSEVVGFGEADHTGNCHSSHYVKGATAYILSVKMTSLLILTLITSLSGFSVENLLEFFPPFHSAFFGRKSLRTAYI